MKTFRHLALILVIGVAFTSGCASTRGGQPAATPASTAAAKKADESNGSIKPYKEVVTEKMASDEGLFTVHRDGQTLLFEIPNAMLGRELLLVTRIARTADEIGYGGEQANNQVVRWERMDDKVLLRIVSYENVADENEPIYQAVRNSNFEPIIQAFDIKALSTDSSSVVIDVSALYTDDVPVLGLQKSRRDTYKVRRLDKTRSFINSAKSYPENVEVRHVLTYDAAEPPSNGSSSSISLEMNQSMILLPADPMQPRLCDKRVGFFSVRLIDYGRDAQRAEPRCFITRWRLEPKDPAAHARGELVEPIKPIVYYIDPATPTKWRPYLKQGVDDWNRAFEAAGFKNAIMAKDPPSPEEDPEFSPEDVRYSVIRYFSSPIENAYGPHVHDPRTGEILESDIGWYHNVMNLLRNWYFIQTAAINPDARSVKFRDEVMGRLIRFVSAHEVGHTIGLPHNWGSSAAYPVDSLRSKAFTDAMGTAPSIMDYARFNYVAQPGDGVTSLMPDIGVYDKWAVQWGYTPIPQAASADEERPILNQWVVERAGDPMYFYGRQGPRIDPRSQNEDLGDDAIKASDYGIANLKIILENLVSWTEEEAKDYDDLNELYGQLAVQWNRYVGHVAANVGGWYENFKTYDQDGMIYAMVPETRQRESLAWLGREVFATPSWMLDESVLRRIEGVGAMDRLRRYQVGAVNTLLDPQRLARMMEAEVMMGDETYTPAELFADLRASIFSELSTTGSIDAFRRNLQRGYLERLEFLMTQEAPPATASSAAFGFTNIDVSQSDIRAYVRGELETLKTEVDRALTRRGDTMRRLHLQDLQARIEALLNPED